MDSFVIHIGFHKSASTYLQEYLFPRLQVNYVFLAGHKREMLNMVQSPTDFNAQVLKDWIREDVGRRYENPHPLTVVSHEELSGGPHGYDDVNPFLVASNLKKAFPSGKVIIIIRNQFGYLLSLYTFRVAIKGYETRNLERFLTEEGAKGLFEKLEYDRIVERYLSLFGRENVLVLPIELLRNDSQGFNDAVTDFLGVPPIAADAVRPVNESTKLLAVLQFWRPINYCFGSFLGLLRFLHIQPEEEYPYQWLRYKYYGVKRRTTARLNRLFETSSRIDISSYTGYKALEARYAASNARLQESIGVNLKECGYPSGG